MVCLGQWQDQLVQKAVGVTDLMAHLSLGARGCSHPEVILETGSGDKLKA